MWVLISLPLGCKAVAGFLWCQSWLRAVLLPWLQGGPLLPCSAPPCQPEALLGALHGDWELLLCLSYWGLSKDDNLRPGAQPSPSTMDIRLLWRGHFHLGKTLRCLYSISSSFSSPATNSLQLWTTWSTEPKALSNLSVPITSRWSADFFACVL